MSKLKEWLDAVKMTALAFWEFVVLGVRPFGPPPISSEIIPGSRVKMISPLGHWEIGTVETLGKLTLLPEGAK